MGNVIIQNRPIGCPRCGIMIAGKEREIKKKDEIVTECIWRCSRCSSLIKHGVTKITPIIKK